MKLDTQHMLNETTGEKERQYAGTLARNLASVTGFYVSFILKEYEDIKDHCDFK